jgi:putative membrane protein
MSDPKDRPGPVLFDLSLGAQPAPGPRGAEPLHRPERPVETRMADPGSAPVNPADAPPVPDMHAAPTGAAMQAALRMGGRRGSALARVFWGALAGLVSLLIGIALWDFAFALLDRAPILGALVAALTAAVLLAALAFAGREALALSRLSRLDTLQRAAARARADADLEGARRVADALVALYKARPELEAGRAKLVSLRGEMFEAETVLSLAEDALLAPLDKAAQEEISAAARQVATVTAIVPLAAADVIAALTANLRMIRRIAEIYGGRGGSLGNWRLTRTVFTHLVATGAVAVGDDMIGSIAGGGVLAKLSRRFGEGVVNGALTARVGVAALEVCRPLPFGAGKRPSTTGLTRRALTGLFSGSGASQTGDDTPR